MSAGQQPVPVFYQPPLPPRPRSGGGRGGGGGIAVILILVSVTIAVVILRRRARDKGKKKRKKSFDDVLDNKLVSAEMDKLDKQIEASAQKMEKAGLTSKEAEEVEKILEEQGKSACIFDTDGGWCPDGTTINDETGCCELDSSSKDPIMEKLDIAKSLAFDVGVGFLFDKFFLDPFLVKMSAKKGANVGAKVAAKAAGAGAKSGAKAGGSAAATAAISGPLLAATILFEIASTVLDVVDPSGYNTYVSAATYLQMRKVLDYTMQNNSPDKYPFFLSGATLWPQVYEIASVEMSTEYAEKASKEIDEDKDFMNSFDELVKAGDMDGAVELMKDGILTKTASYSADDPKKHDKKLFDKMEKILKDLSRDFAQDLKYYDEAFEKYGTGIGVTGVGVGRWNQKWMSGWLTGKNMDKMVGVLTDSYYELNMDDPGTADKPNMKYTTIPNSLPFLMPYASLIKGCEGKIRVASGPDIDPVKLGAKFDMSKGICSYSKKYCERYGLETKTNTDEASGMKYMTCHNPLGQKISEAIFGTTVTRIFKKIEPWSNLARAIDDWTNRDPRECIIPEQMDVDGKCRNDGDCNDNERCARESGYDTGMCTTSSLMNRVGARCSTIQAFPTDPTCPTGLDCVGTEKPEWIGEGICRYPFSSDTGDVPYAVCLGSRELFYHTPHRQRLQEVRMDNSDLTRQTKCMRDSRFDSSKLGTRVHCPAGYIDIAYDKSNCAQGIEAARRAYCVKESEMDKPGTGYKVFQADEVEIRKA